MIVVTSGEKFIDIDAYASIIAYSELLRLKGHDAIAVNQANFASSINKTVANWDVDVFTKFTSSQKNNFILLDISNPEHFAKFVELDNVIEVIDHHPGFEEYWNEKIGHKSKIELVGACSTQIYEQWAESGLVDRISINSAKLLICGILDNTLNFGAKITSRRDTNAYEKLMSVSGLPKDWPEVYFSECQEDIFHSPKESIINDTKSILFNTFDDEITIGQVTLWDGKGFLKTQQPIFDELSSKYANYFVNIISIKDKSNYIYCTNPKLKTWLSRLLEFSFDGNTGKTKRLWLRKEIMHQDLTINKQYFNN